MQRDVFFFHVMRICNCLDLPVVAQEYVKHAKLACTCCTSSRVPTDVHASSASIDWDKNDAVRISFCSAQHTRVTCNIVVHMRPSRCTVIRCSELCVVKSMSDEVSYSKVRNCYHQKNCEAQARSAESHRGVAKASHTSTLHEMPKDNLPEHCKPDDLDNGTRESPQGTGENGTDVGNGEASLLHVRQLEVRDNSVLQILSGWWKGDVAGDILRGKVWFCME